MLKKTYRGREDLKAEAISRAIAHREADALFHGIYCDLTTNGAFERTYAAADKDNYDAALKLEGVRFIGCAVGCLATPPNGRSLRQRLSFRRLTFISMNPYQALSRELGIPASLARVADAIFESHVDLGEGPADSVAARWPERFVTMIPVGLRLDKALEENLDLLYDDVMDGEMYRGKIEGAKRRLKLILDRAAARQAVAA